MTSETAIVRGIWNDPDAPVADRVAALAQAMTLDEKVAQLYGVWVGAPVPKRSYSSRARFALTDRCSSYRRLRLFALPIQWLSACIDTSSAQPRFNPSTPGSQGPAHIRFAHGVR